MLNTFDWTKLLLPFMVVAVSAFAAFEAVEQTKTSAKKALWTALAGVALGFGLWSADTLSVLSWHLGVRRFYDAGDVLLSIAVVTAASWTAMRVLIREQPRVWASGILAAAMLNLGFGALHLLGIASLHMSPMRWNLPWLAVSLLAPALPAWFAMRLLAAAGGQVSGFARRLEAALIFGLTVIAMHFAGVRALLLTPATHSHAAALTFSGLMLARLGITSVFLFTFGLLVLSYRAQARWAQIAHEARHQAQESSRQAERLAAAGKIAASIAHEINNPLEAVVNILYLLESAQLSEREREYLTKAQDEVDRVAEITTHTLKFYRQQSAPAVTAIPDLFETALTLFQSRLQKAGITVERAWPGDIAPILCCAGEIRQVLANLVSNAIDAMPEGGRLKLGLRATPAELEIEVEDTGRGISSELQKEIFEPFFTTKGLGGTGLGLSISAEIVERHGGRIHLSSSDEPGRAGTRFQVLLPYMRERPSAAQAHAGLAISLR